MDTQQDATASGLAFIPGVIVNIKFREQCLDFKELKKEFKQYSFVQFVEILEGGAQCFIRVDSANSAQELVSQYSSCEYETDVLKDEAEKEYWKKIFEKRDNKKNKETPKKEQPQVKRRRGREKLLEKIAKAAQHIRFDEAEENLD
jgi:La-related protein 7